MDHLSSGVAYGSTPLEPDEASQLVPGVSASTKEEVDALEERGFRLSYTAELDRIVDEEIPVELLLDDLYLRNLHGQFLGGVWLWAGKYRVRELNIGISPAGISAELRSLVDNARWCLDNRTMADWEVLMRLSHGIARIHPFVNGNGRTSRLYVGLVQLALGTEPDLSWGARSDLPYPETKAHYLRALRHADRTGDVHPLWEYANS